jgi:2-oxoglutarate dehydrogenase complex dehydrogenase (E1) component-like enzyme
VVRYVGREESASPASGSHRVHVAEQESIVANALAAPVETPLAVRQAAPAS